MNEGSIDSDMNKANFHKSALSYLWNLPGLEFQGRGGIVDFFRDDLAPSLWRK